MNEISSLSQKFKQKSQQQVQSIEQELQNATTQLSSFMTAKLKESETIIKQGMDSLNVSNEQLQQMLAKHQTDINTALTAYLNNVQAHTAQDLKQLAEQTETMIESYTQHIEQLIQVREDRIAKIIKSEMRSWAIGAGILAVILLMMGVLLGAWTVNKFSKQTVTQQSGNPVFNQQQLNYGQQR
uniref:Uncharacterized protein n=1 Tax=Psychrobacter sp. DAB_AL109bw TaxID=1028409 RepID=H9C6K6_9GAMM|nr:hypothetical protein [Psychrobacter sp. DAB_AL109bw]